MAGAVVNARGRQACTSLKGALSEGVRGRDIPHQPYRRKAFYLQWVKAA